MEKHGSLKIEVFIWLAFMTRYACTRDFLIKEI
jgi:hypothetical protein